MLKALINQKLYSSYSYQSFTMAKWEYKTLSSEKICHDVILSHFSTSLSESLINTQICTKYMSLENQAQEIPEWNASTWQSEEMVSGRTSWAFQVL